MQELMWIRQGILFQTEGLLILFQQVNGLFIILVSYFLEGKPWLGGGIGRVSTYKMLQTSSRRHGFYFHIQLRFKQGDGAPVTIMGVIDEDIEF
jgi:hypothetical protein